MGRKRFSNVGEIREVFIKDGWNDTVSFSELTEKEATSNGQLFAVRGMQMGHRYFVMVGNGNIYDETGKIVYYNLGRKE